MGERSLANPGKSSLLLSYNRRLILFQRECVMKYVNELKREIGATQQQVVEWKKNESANALKEGKEFL